MAEEFKRKDLIEAKRRGLLDREEVERTRPQRHERICIQCGQPFRPFDEHRKEMFGCACCAERCNVEKLDRRIFPGVRVMYIPTGEAGRVIGVEVEDGSEPIAVVRMERGGDIKATAIDLERVHRFVTRHIVVGCKHGLRKREVSE